MHLFHTGIPAGLVELCCWRTAMKARVKASTHYNIPHMSDRLIGPVWKLLKALNAFPLDCISKDDGLTSCTLGCTINFFFSSSSSAVSIQDDKSQPQASLSVGRGKLRPSGVHQHCKTTQHYWWRWWTWVHWWNIKPLAEHNLHKM